MGHIVILVHGIRDFALWQNNVRTSLEKKGLLVEATNYGRFNLIEFLLPVPFFRKKAIATIENQIRIIRHNNPGSEISIIAHSFGTFVVARLMQQNFDFRFRRIIFCGSVVPFFFPFEQVGERFTPPILNEVGTRDIWPALAESITFGYGSAGTYGFRRPLVRDRWHNGAHHGYFLDSSFCETYWIPFLLDGSIVPGDLNPEPPRLWLRILSVLKFRYGLVALLSVAAVIGIQRAAAPPHIAPTFEPSRPAIEAYCSDIKEVLASAPGNFQSILAGTYGENRIPSVPLGGWEDCMIFMGNRVSQERRYNCVISGFTSSSAVIKEAETITDDIKNKCLGINFSISRGVDFDEIPRWRIVGRGTTASIVIRPSKSLLKPTWEANIDVYYQ